MKHSLREFDAEKLAHYDTAMWRAYYGHRFFVLMYLFTRTLRAQFGFTWFRAAKAAFYSGRGAARFRKNASSQDYSSTLTDLQVFFGLIDSYTTEHFDTKLAAELELKWWLIHRYPKRHTETLNDGLAAAMGVVYSVEPKMLADYADNRAKAMHVRDVATWQTKTEPDWDEIDRLLVAAYRSLFKTVQRG